MDQGATNTLIEGNYIGTNSTGDAAVSNTMGLAIYLLTARYLEARAEGDLAALADFYAVYTASTAPDEARLAVLDQPDGVWPCQNHFKCTQACPRAILITKRINQTKRMIKEWKGDK